MNNRQKVFVNKNKIFRQEDAHSEDLCELPLTEASKLIKKLQDAHLSYEHNKIPSNSSVMNSDGSFTEDNSIIGVAVRWKEEDADLFDRICNPIPCREIPNIDLKTKSVGIASITAKVISAKNE